MGLGSTAKKIQVITERAEQLYKLVQELQARIVGLEGAVDDTHETVRSLERDVAEQRALLAAIAEQQGIDVEAVAAEAAVEDVDPDESSAETSEGADSSDTSQVAAETTAAQPGAQTGPADGDSAGSTADANEDQTGEK